MTNLLFQRIQFPDITSVNHQEKMAHQGLPRFLVALGVVVLILLAVGAALLTHTGQDRPSESPANPSHTQPAPLDLFP
ncbi:MAG TPA: hypothetical protein VG347_05985 [Verrucomicrobiae bacterium]|nr:hypothetical protein [Verrucomicrobiae bacterium]